MTEPNLITSVILQGREYLVKMNVLNKYLELVITDKQTGEEWQCSYDHAYIENLTHKTGNFKQYDVFISMIKSGLLKTSDSITLELLTLEDLDTLRAKKLRSYNKHFNNAHNNNRRYLIITYSVEFDRIHYPLPLEYCGPPDPTVLQATIRKLETELSQAREELSSRGMRTDTKQILMLQRRVDDLLLENADLKNEIAELQVMVESGPKSQVKLMQRAIVNLEKSVLSERKSHHQLVDKLRSDKIRLLKELEKSRSVETSLRVQLDKVNKTAAYRPKRMKAKQSDLDSLETIFRRPTLLKSRSDDTRQNCRARSLSPRLTKSDGCDHYSKKEKNRKKSTKPRSRSSSQSSSRNLGTFFALVGDGRSNSPSMTSEVKVKRKSKTSRSRSSSRDSGENSTSDNYKPTSIRGIRSRLRSSDRDFIALENRIQALQDILKDSTKASTI